MAIPIVVAVMLFTTTLHYIVERSSRVSYFLGHLLEISREAYEEEKQMHQNLLESILPKPILQKLACSSDLVIAESVEEATVMIIDIVKYASLHKYPHNSIQIHTTLQCFICPPNCEHS